MISKNIVASVSKAVKSDAVAVLNQKLEHNIWATPSRDSPNADKLKDGAIQRASVSVPEDRLAWTHLNPEKIGSYKRPEHNSRASAGALKWIAPWDDKKFRSKIARIYMP